MSSNNMKHFLKLGPWGNKSSQNWSFRFDEDQGLKSIKVRHADVVDAIAFTVADQFFGHDISEISFGGEGGHCDEIVLDIALEEYITQISGTRACYLNAIDCITSIMIHTNLKAYGPYGLGSIEGKHGATNVSSFLTPFISIKSIAGFFGGANKYLESIGIFIYPDEKLKECKRKLKAKEEEIEVLEKEIQKLSDNLIKERQMRDTIIIDLMDIYEKRFKDEQNKKKQEIQELKDNYGKLEEFVRLVDR